jgi:histidine triad (HIT) family protein
MNQTIATLRQRGVCFSCRDFATGEVFEKQPLIYEDACFRVALDLYPRMPGHTIVVNKPHREDISELSQEEAGQLFQLCIQVVKALNTDWT